MLQLRWAQITHDWMETQWKSPQCGEMGISLVSCIRFNHSPLPAPWRNIVFGYREMSAEELREKKKIEFMHFFLAFFHI